MSKKNDNVTVDRRKAEEELCWKEYEEAKAAEEAENAAQVQAMLDSMDDSSDEVEEGRDESFLDITEPAERTLRRKRRRGEIKSKKRMVRNAAYAAANEKVREERDEKSCTQRDRGTGEKIGDRKSQKSKVDRLVKKAEKVSRKK